MQKSVAISATIHAAVLAWGVLSFASKPYKVDSIEALPIDLVSISDFSQMTSGSKTGTRSDNAKPLAEKVGEPRPAENPAAKVVPKNEIKAASEPPPAPAPKPSTPAPKVAAETPPPKPTPAPKAKAQPQPQRDLIAEAIKKEEAKKPDPKPELKPDPKPVEAKTPVPQRKPAPPVPAFDANQVMALLDKRAPQRQAAVGDTLVATPPRGVPGGQAALITQSELDALRARLMQLWSPPAGAKDPEELVVQIRIMLTPDGRLAGPPMVLTSGTSPLFMAARESAMRALFRGQPFDMLKPEHYEQWRDVEITFDPRQMFRG